MGQSNKLETDEQRLKLIAKQSEKQEAAKYSLWDKLAKMLMGVDQHERRGTKRGPNP